MRACASAKALTLDSVPTVPEKMMAAAAMLVFLD